MKKLIFILALIASIKANAQNQQKFVEDGKVAHATENRDTLYVLHDMFSIFAEIWDKPEYLAEKPVMIPVKSLDPYIKKEE